MRHAGIAAGNKLCEIESMLLDIFGVCIVIFYCVRKLQCGVFVVFFEMVAAQQSCLGFISIAFQQFVSSHV